MRTYLLVPGQRDSASHLRAEHRVVAEEWLKLRSDLRLALIADNTNSEGLAATRKERGRNYHPYYAIGDFNGDGKEDFAVALVKKKRSEWPFLFAIFNGPSAKATKPSFIIDADEHLSMSRESSSQVASCGTKRERVV